MPKKQPDPVEPVKDAVADETPETPTNGQRAEATDDPIVFEWDGEEWSFLPSAPRQLEYLAALEDAGDGDAFGFVRSLRILLGHQQAARLFEGREVSAVHDFFTAAGEAAKTGNR